MICFPPPKLQPSIRSESARILGRGPRSTMALIYAVFPLDPCYRIRTIYFELKAEILLNKSTFFAKDLKFFNCKCKKLVAIV
jgi:hypothetical protein